MAHLVLDLDGTLVRDGIARPHLFAFLKFCFDQFATVSIWTAASREWWAFCYSEHMLPHGFEFDQVLTRDDCELSNGEVRVIKPLRKLWAKGQALTERNTLIVDDTASTALYNRDNLIVIPDFVSLEDTALLDVQVELDRRIQLFKQTGDVRSVEQL